MIKASPFFTVYVGTVPFDSDGWTSSRDDILNNVYSVNMEPKHRQLINKHGSLAWPTNGHGADMERKLWPATLATLPDASSRLASPWMASVVHSRRILGDWSADPCWLLVALLLHWN